MSGVLPRAATLIELLRGRAEERPDRTAFRFLADGEIETELLTFGELDRRARSIGAALAERAAPGTRVCLFFPPGVDYIAALFGSLYAGLAAVPAYPPRSRKRLPRLEALIDDPDQVIALTKRNVLSLLQPSLESAPAKFRKLRWMVTDDGAPGRESDWRQPEVTGQSPAIIQYTSGSTTRPRGVVLSHQNLLHNLSQIRQRFGLGDQSRGVIWLPPYHDMGLIGGILQPVYSGFECTLMSPAAFLQSPARWLAAISKYGATISGGPDFAFDLCVRKIGPEDREKLNLSTWELAFNGAEPVRWETMERFAEAFRPSGFRCEAFRPCYGLAEATLMVSSGRVSEPLVADKVEAAALGRHQVARGDGARAVILTGCGGAVDGTDIRIVDPHSLTEAGEKCVGEIWVSGPSVAAGYFQCSEDTAETFEAQLNGVRYLRTGDLGYLRDGELFVTGRLKDLIVIRGTNYYPHDIEAALKASHPALERSNIAAFGIPGGAREQLIVVVEADRRGQIRAAEVTAAARSAVAEVNGLEIDALVLVKAGGIPKTSSGKIRRGACRDAYLGGSLEPVAEWKAEKRAAVARRSETEIRNWLTGAVAERAGVGVGEIDARRPFVDYGLESADAVALSVDLENWLGQPAPPMLIWDFPSIDSLASHLTQNGRPVEKASHTAAMAGEPIAIIGMSCRFPGAADPEAFWDLLRQGHTAVGEVPAERWSHSGESGEGARWGAFLNGVDQFDPYFFGISPREAANMDPQQRILLEVTWKALENAGLAPPLLAGSATGVFVGISSSDYAREQTRNNGSAPLDIYSGTGNALSIAANRISYSLDLKGPSLAVDTACSSSLVAVHLAAQSLRCGESNLAIAGGVSLILSPEASIVFSRAKMLSPEGKCKVFDAAADGYVRGEGCGVVLLKRLPDALADGDHICGLILASGVNQDGRTNGLTAPNGPSQHALVTETLAKAGISQEEIGYVETHGTGTPLGDPIEVQSLAETFVRGSAEDADCWMGSVKANVGHLEPAAGVASLIKTLLALEKEAIPPQVHFQNLNPHIALDGTRLRIPVELTAWRRGEGRRLALVESFGFGGTNAAVILAESPLKSVVAAVASDGVTFQRERYWIEKAPAAIPDEVQLRPMANRRLAAALPIFEVALSTQTMPWLSAHQVRGQIVFPAAGYLEMAIEAAMEEFGDGSFELTDIAFVRALLLEAGQRYIGQTVFSKTAAGGAAFQIFSRPEDGEEWTLHCSGTILPGSSREPLPCPQPFGSELDVRGVYRDFAASGLEYGDQFQGLRQIWREGKRTLARVELHAALAPVAGDFAIHPALLDSCLHVMGPALAQDHRGTGLPLAMERFEWHGAFATQGWVSGELTAATAGVRMWDDAGQPVFTISGLRLEGVEYQAGSENLLHELRWEPAALSSAQERLSGSWVILPDETGLAEELAGAIRENGGAGEIHRGDPDSIPASATGVVCLVDGESSAAETLLLRVLGVVKAVAGARLWLVTRGALSNSPAAYAVWGLGRVAALEYPGLQCTLVDLDPLRIDAADLVAELGAVDGETQVAYRDGVRLVARIARAEFDSEAMEPPPGESYRLETSSPGNLEALRLAASTRRLPGPGEVEVRARAAGLNFSDVMKSLGVYPASADGELVLGAEFAGVIERIGEGVTEFAAGDLVMGIAANSFSPFVTTPDSLVVRIPDNLRMEEAATVPVAFLTAAYSLNHLARIQKGERVLIHAGAGGVGLAAIQLAQRAGAEIFATAGSPEKRAYLESLGCAAVFDSRSLDFVEGVRAATGGRGVDVVLNSLAGEAMTGSLDLVAPHGRFVEIGKSDIYQNRPLSLAPFQRAIAYFAVDLDRMFRERRETIRKLLAEIAAGFERRELKPLPLRLFEMREARQAFRHMAQARHTGKVVVIPADPAPALFRPDATYLITGGLGALGLQAARWIADSGAQHLVLMGRNGPSRDTEAVLAALRERGIDVTVKVADVSDERALEELPPLRGILHAAGILADATIANLDEKRLHAVIQPKIGGAWALHQATQGMPLDFFVLFSSFASVVGSPGQANYAAANAFLDGLAHYRKQMGLAALSVNWGPWEGSGMAAGMQSTFDGVRPLKPDAALRQLGQLLRNGASGQFLVGGVDWNRLSARLPGGVPPLLSGVCGPALHAADNAGDGLRENLMAATSEERRQSLEGHILEQVGRVSGIPIARLDRTQSLGDLGIDSLTALELTNSLEQTLKVSLPLTLMSGNVSVSDLAAQIADRLMA